MKKAMVLMAFLIVQMAFSQGVAQGKKNRDFSSFDQLDAAGIGAGYRPRFERVDDADLQFEGVRFYDKAPTPPQSPKPELGPIDKWRYESCQQDAATAPTSQGVIIKMRVCRDKFGQ